MKTILSDDLQGKLQVNEVANDFKLKVNQADKVLQHNSVDAHGGELLIIYVPAHKVDTDPAKAILASSLSVIGSELAATLPDPQTPEVEPTTEVDKAVIDQPEPPSSGTKASKGKRKSNDTAAKETGHSEHAVGEQSEAIA